MIHSPSSPGRISTSGTTSCGGDVLIARRRLRIEAADFRDHLAEIFHIDAAHRYQPAQVSLRQQVEVVQQCLHRGIKPIALGKLCRKTFPQVACEQTDRIELHHDRTHRLETLEWNRHRVGDRQRVRGQPAGRAQQGDQMHTNHPINRIFE